MQVSRRDHATDPRSFLGVIGGSILLLFLQAINWIVDVYLRSANSAIAANTMVRSLFGAGCASLRPVDAG